MTITWKELRNKLNAATEEQLAGPVTVVIFGEVVEVKVEVAAVEEKKNRRAVKAQPGRKYILLAKSLADWGRIPRQQWDLADILVSEFAVGAEVEESEVFARVTARAVEYPSLANSVQHPTSVLARYRSYDKKNGKHCGFIQRGFLQVKG
jgi:hypothetical protein